MFEPGGSAVRNFWDHRLATSVNFSEPCPKIFGCSSTKTL